MTTFGTYITLQNFSVDGLLVLYVAVESEKLTRSNIFQCDLVVSTELITEHNKWLTDIPFNMMIKLTAKI